MEKQARAFEGMIREPSIPNDDRTELHVVGLYEGAHPDGPGRGVADVDVHYPGQPIVLALCAYEPTKWRLRIGNGVIIKKVVLGGTTNKKSRDCPKA